jgi:formylglycine-generating enzyme required for sulfatase activity
LGISRDDAMAYVRWRNKQAEKKGEPWLYDLPKEEEWEKAARGVDERSYPWGDRFDSSLCVSAYFKPWGQPWLPTRYEPRDESPFGVADVAGSRWDYTRTRPPDTSPVNRGGGWNQTDAMARCCSRGYVHSFGNVPGNMAGLRLVARRRE